MYALQNRVQRYYKKMKNTNNSVKKHRTYLVLLFTILFSGSAGAVVNNYMGAYALVGEWSLRPSQSEYNLSYGVAGGLGFMYEMQAGAKYKPTRFLLDIGVGALGGMTSFGQSSNETAVLNGQKDLQDELFDYVYDIKNRHDQYTDVAVQVPLMVGLQHRKFYMLVGAKFNYHIYTIANTKANITTFGQYEKIPDLRDMPEYQFFSDKPMRSSAKTELDWDIVASFEIGGRFGVITEEKGYDVPKRMMELRLAGFVDYGLRDIHKKGNNSGISTEEIFYDTRKYVNDKPNPDYVYQNTSMIDNLKMNDIMSTEKNGVPFAKAVNSMMIGLKLTILFQLPEPGQCVLCKDGYQSIINSSRGRLKYEE